MKKYALYTEHKSNLPTLTNKYFKGFSIYRGLGYWQGAQEKSTQIVVFGNNSDLKNLKRLAYDIKKVNKQEAVLLEVNGQGRLI